jgi:tryptophan synthase alpha chain
MKSAIDQVFHRLRLSGDCAFIPYLTAGFPDPATCVEILLALDDNGADIIEVGIPFSDPLADGPTIQWASRTALDNGMTVKGAFEIVESTVPHLKSPVVLMTYCNPLFKMGPARFAARAREAGVYGVIVPDLPVDEAEPWMEAADRYSLDTIFLVGPTTTPRRMQDVVSRTTGFLYYVSMTGVTGSSLTLSENLFRHVTGIRSLSDIPVAVGFGISSPQHARELAGVADGVIVGSEIIRRIRSESSPNRQIAVASSLARAFSQALKNGTGGSCIDPDALSNN